MSQKIASVEIDGKEYRMAYDFSKIVEVEAEGGGNLLRGLTDLANLSAAELRGLVCAAIRAGSSATKKNPPITISQVAAMTRYDTIFPLTEALSQSILYSLPKRDSPKPPAPDEKPEAQTENPVETKAEDKPDSGAECL